MPWPVHCFPQCKKPTVCKFPGSRQDSGHLCLSSLRPWTLPQLWHFRSPRTRPQASMLTRERTAGDTPGRTAVTRSNTVVPPRRPHHTADAATVLTRLYVCFVSYFIASAAQVVTVLQYKFSTRSFRRVRGQVGWLCLFFPAPRDRVAASNCQVAKGCSSGAHSLPHGACRRPGQLSREAIKRGHEGRAGLAYAHHPADYTFGSAPGDLPLARASARLHVLFAECTLAVVADVFYVRRRSS